MTARPIIPLPVKVRIAIAADLRGSEDTYRAIAARHSVSLSAVGRVASESGIYRRPRGKSAADLIRSGSIRLGCGPLSFAGWLLTMPDDVINWLHSETPHTSSIADLARAIIVDAYHDSQERQSS